jgi:hypothetical protein
MMNRFTVYNIWQQLSALTMAVMLLWLTVSLPFVQRANDRNAVATEQVSAADDFFGSTNEEKSETSTNALSEFLHEANTLVQPLLLISRTYQTLSLIDYLPHYPDCFYPPPEA